MRTLEYFLVLILLVFQNACSGNLISSPNQEWVFDYKGFLDTSSSACNKSFARWSIAGKLIFQVHNNAVLYFQLDNIKTSIFNGQREDVDSAIMKELSDEAKILSKPFIAHLRNDSFIFLQNEPLWSINMKRGIASQFLVKFGVFVDDKITYSQKPQRSIYGDCNIESKIENDNGNIKVKSTINLKECKNSPFNIKSNHNRAVRPNNNKFLNIKATRYYQLNKAKLPLIVKVVSITNITYGNIKIGSTQHIDQYQEFKVSSHQPKIARQINVEENTNERDIIYEFDIDSVYPRVKKYFTENELVNQYLDNQKKLFEKINEVPTKNVNLRNEDYAKNMYFALLDMKQNGLNQLGKEVMNHAKNGSFASFMTMLPYIGTNEATKFIANYIGTEIDLNSNPYLLMRLLAIFPLYIKHPTEKVVNSFEFLLDLKNTTDHQLKTSGVLSFSSIMASAFKKKMINEDKMKKYKNLLYEKFLHGDNYETRMKYLLGLVNVVDELDLDFIIPILTNSSESNHLRALGMSSFKSLLISKPDKVFRNFWSIVINKVESFDVRVASLDLVLSVDLSKEHFNKMIEYYKRHPEDVYEKNLFQYFHTTIQTIINSSNNKNPLSSKFNDLLKKDFFTKYAMNYHIWLTSNYKIDYSDIETNTEKSFQLRLITNPATNKINTVQLSYTNLFKSFDMGTYNIYLKLDQGHEMVYKYKTLEKLKTNHVSIPELVELMREFSIEMKNEKYEFHLEIVVFLNNRAVFAMHINRNNVEEFRRYYEHFFSFKNETIVQLSYPLIEYVNIPSDFGTSIKITNDIQEIAAHQYIGEDDLVTYNWYFQTWLESYIPVVDTTIASFKHFEDNKNMFASQSINIGQMSAIFWHWKDSLSYSWDNILGTSVADKNKLHEYCVNCDDIHEISTDIIDSEILNLDAFTFMINYTSMKHTNEIESFSEFIHKKKFNPYKNELIINYLAKPLLMYWYYEDYKYSIAELRRDLYRSFPINQDEVFIMFEIEKNSEKRLDSIYAVNINNITLNFLGFNISNHEHLVTWNIKLGQKINPGYNDHGKQSDIIQIKTLDMEFQKINETDKKLNVLYKLALPSLNTDRYSILPPQSAMGTMEIKFCELSSKSEESYFIKSQLKYLTSEKLKNEIMSSKEYSKCKEQMQGLKFTPITKECVVNSHMLLNDYDYYESNLNYANSTHGNISHLENIFYSFTKDNGDKLKIKQQVPIWGQQKYEEFSSSIYYPFSIISPSAIVYNDYDILEDKIRKCVVTPMKVITFTNHIISLNEKNLVAMIECLKYSLSGLKIEKISDKHIGFKFWIVNNTISATIEDNQVQVKLNENELQNKVYDEENNVLVDIIDNSVVFIVTESIRIYYNTEYISIDVNSLYSTRLCGFCNDHN